MEHMVSKLACLATVAGLSFGALADDEPAEPEVFSQGGVSWTDPSIVANTVGGRTLLIVTNVAAAATVTAERTVTLARALVVGGGGGGGSTIGGGGGGGGATEWSDADLVLEAGGALEISIGKGGIGGGRTGNTASTWPRGTNGGASTLTLVGGEWLIEALGGGGGGAWNDPSANGGMTVANPGGPCKGAARPAAGTSGYLSGTSSGESPGGGAGAGGDGGNGVNRGAAGDGGIGHRSDITGEYAYYGGGGAGSGGNSCTTGGKGGLGGGANGVDVNAKAADTLKDGVNGLGGGGAGGSHNQSNNGGNGGSGCVILVFAEGDLTERQLVVAEIPDQPFDGEPSVPAPVVTNKKSGEPLSAEDYDVTYSNNFGIGTATVTVVGKGEYLGERKVLAFEIVLPSEEDRISLAGDFSPKSIREGVPARIACLQVLDANGEPVDPSLYEVGYANNLVRGTATVWAKMKSGDLTGVIAARTFEVVHCLPAEYEYVEWIASSGDQWIDTGVVPKQATTGVDIRFGQVKNAGSQVIFAQAWSWGNGFLFQVNPSFRFDNNKTLDGYAAGRDYHVTIAPGGIVTMDYGQGVVTNTGYNNGTGTQTLGLFAPNGGGNYRSTFRLYSFLMTSGETVVSDLLPVRRISDGKPGLYDFAQADPEKAFLVNKRTGADFTSGPAVTHFDVAPIPVQTYRGVPLTPPLTLTDRATGMEVSTNDFTIAYTNNDAACIATATVVGKPGTAYEGERRDVTFAIEGILRVTGDAMDTGSGASWADAMTWTNALQRAVTSDVPHEIWVSGTTLLTANTSYSFTKWPVTIRGGFTGTETDPDERATNAVATVDAQDTIKYGLNLSNGANAPVVIERISFIRGVVRSLTRSGAGDFTLRNCRMALRTKENGNTPGTLYDGNASGTAKRTTGGGGANLTGSGDARLVVEGCSFDGNNVRGEWTGSGPAMWVGGFKTVLFENTSFTTNWWKYSRQGAYACIQLYNQPNATFRGCDFRGNYGQGEILELEGSCGGTVFQNCVFAGNECSGSSLVLANLDAASSTVAFTNCTFAYNFLSSGCAIRVAKGTLTATSTIFHRNLMGNASTLGADVALTSADASALLSYCSFEDTKGDYLSATADGSLVCANCIRIVDPMFVTATDAFMSELKVTTFPRATYTPGYNRRSGYDVHLMSSAGHFANDGAEHVAEGVYSPAIDKGEKASTAWQDEPEPNGGRVNLGAYGGTDRASKTVPSDPTVDPAAISVTYPGEYSQPLVTFAMAGEGIYSRDVVVSVLTNGVVAFSPVTLPSLTNGQAVACLMPGYLVRGDSMTVRIEIEGVVTPIVSAAFEVQGELPPWTGKGGDPSRVIHVRTGATGKGDGTSWTDAFETLAEALANRTASIEEIWFAGTNVYSVAPATYSFAAPFAIRGGFTGCENAQSERRPGARSVIDAAYKGRALKISNSADVVLDGLILTRGSVHNLERSGAGNLTLTNCALTCCSGGTLYDGNGSGSANRNQGGGGFCLSGSGASELLVVDSEIGGNQAGGEWVASGCGGWMSGFKSATFEGTLFATNSHNSGRNGCMAAVMG